MARPKSAIPYTRRHITIPTHIAEEVDVLLTDPLLQQVTPGLWSKLVTTLLRELLSIYNGHRPPETFDLSTCLHILSKHTRG